METSRLKRFAQYARRSLIEQVSAKLNLVLANESAARRENAAAVKTLDASVKEHGRDQVIERVAYTWFNRFCALRFMDVNRHNRIGIVSPMPGQFQPEILAEAKMGHIDDELVAESYRDKVVLLLAGKSPSRDPQGEAYRLLVVAACNYWHRAMPFLFERIEDYTELLMPDDLLSGNSILAYTRETMTPDVCKDVEVIGWLYQFYVSEKKDEVFAILKKGKKIEPENIPASTQLFTPDYIVNYLVENSLGRLWMLNRPKSGLVEKMEYYIKPEQTETDFLRISKPEDIKICDPACGSGHMLVYAFDLLYDIYKEVYGDEPDISERILTHNLYGVEIDERAGELAAFALTMKALQYDKRFIRRSSIRVEPVKPNICVLENAELTNDQTNSEDWKKIVEAMAKTGVDKTALIHDLHLFAEADNFGSLLKPRLSCDNLRKALSALNSYDQSVNAPSFDHRNLIDKCRLALQQADYLTPKYQAVVANPPYMGSGGMNGRLSSWAKSNYPDSKSDLFAMFMERNLELAINKGFVAMITMQSWMFLSNFEKLRKALIEQRSLLSMAHLGARAFDSIGGEVVSTTAFVFKNTHDQNRGTYCRLVDGKSEAEKDKMFKTALLDLCKNRLFTTSTSEFTKIPECPFAYWLSQNAFEAFNKFGLFAQSATACQGLATTDNNRYVRFWAEVSKSHIGFGFKNRAEAANSNLMWFPLDKGGALRKWFGNNDYIVNWKNDGEEIRTAIINKYPYLKGNPDFVAKNPSKYFLPGVTWGKVTTGLFSARYSPSGAIFSDAGMKAFESTESGLLSIAGLFNSKVTPFFLAALSETINFEQGNIARLPYIRVISSPAKKLIDFAKDDWDSYETSWDFTVLPLLSQDICQLSLEETYMKLRSCWRNIVLEMQRLEEENNRLFIDEYGLKSDLDQTVPVEEITLRCNPYCRYGGDKSEDELESLLLADTMREFVSYAVGCMFGRYALDKPGLILANQGESFEDYRRQISEPSFPADKDNVIPMLDGDWFADDISERFLKFLRVTFGEAHFEENLKFIETALGKDLRKYFLKDFYNDHVKRFKKRPIYWLFSSPKGSFNALIYMHRYRPDTVSVVLNEYLREFRNKLTSRLDHLKRVEASADASKGEKTKAIKEIESLKKIIEELAVYERDILYPLATEQKEIDLDNGVKHNYALFGAALKKIPGLDVQED